MSNEPLTDEQALEEISAILRRMDFSPGNLPGGWVLAYETSGITDEGDVGGNWGDLAQASIPVIVGLCHLVAADAPRHSEN